MKAKKHLHIPSINIPLWWPSGPGWQRLARWLLPSPGNIFFTLLVVAGLLWATSAGALPFRAPTLAGDSTTTISYQGRLADSSGNPVTTSGVGMQFRLYNTDTGGSPLWEESHTAVPVEDGLFHVLLGSTNPIPVSLLANNSTLWLGITVGSDSEMTPREQIASVPYAMVAGQLAGETFHTLTLGSWVDTATNADANFGTIDLPVASNLYVMSMWVLQNNSSDAGLRAGLRIDDTSYSVYADGVALSRSGIGYTVARNHYIPNVAAGNHTFSVHIDQHPGRSGDVIAIGPGSVMWIRAVPVR